MTKAVSYDTDCFCFSGLRFRATDQLLFPCVLQMEDWKVGRCVHSRPSGIEMRSFYVESVKREFPN